MSVRVETAGGYRRQPRHLHAGCSASAPQRTRHLLQAAAGPAASCSCLAHQNSRRCLVASDGCRAAACELRGSR